MYVKERRPLPDDGRFCMYLRKSREEERAEKAGREADVLGRHNTMLTLASQMRGHEIERVYREVVSGETIADRSEILAMIDDVQAGMWDGVYVMAVDRLSRGDQGDQKVICDLLSCSGMFVITPSGYYDPLNIQDLDSIAYQLYDAHREYKAAVRRLHDGSCVSALQGQFIGGREPYGFRKVELEYGLKSLEATEEAKWVRSMYEWYAYEDLSMWAIAKRLNDLGVKPSKYTKSGKWRKEAVTYILQNPAYAGKAVWGRHTTKRVFSTDALKRPKVHCKAEEYICVPALWEPVVDQELFDLVQERIKRNQCFSPTKRTVNPLANLLVCAECGRSMLYLNSRGRRRYQHQNWMQDCGQKGAFADVVIEKFAAALQERLDDVEASLSGDHATKEHQRAKEAVANLTSQLEKLAWRDENLIDMRSEREITASELRRSRIAIAEERGRVEERLREAEAVLEREQEAEELSVTLREALDALNDDGLSAAAKNQLLRSFIKRVEYRNESEAGENDKMELTVVFR